MTAPRFPYYVSKANGSIHLPETGNPGYEDAHPDLYSSATSYPEAQALGAMISKIPLTPAAALDVLVDTSAVLMKAPEKVIDVPASIAPAPAIPPAPPLPLNSVLDPPPAPASYLPPGL